MFIDRQNKMHIGVRLYKIPLLENKATRKVINCHLKLWNKLPAEIVSAPSLSVFKRDIRDYLSNLI